MEKFFILLFAIQAIACGDTGGVDDRTGSELTNREVTEALTFHNQARDEVGVPPLEWSAELAAYAQEWAEYLATGNNCQLAHRQAKGKNPKNAGENIFWGGSAVYTTLSACQSWYGEKSKFDPQGSFQSNFSNSGHYMQMVWRDTKTLGMGIAKCPNGAVIIVANYFPAGNIAGQKPY